MLTRSVARLGALARTRALLNHHIEPPSHDTMEEYNRLKRKTPNVVRFTDIDGEDHTMTWEEYIEYQDNSVEPGRSDLDRVSRFKVSLHKVPARGSRLQYCHHVFRNCSLEEAETNAKYLQLNHYSEIFSALMAKGREKANELEMDTNNVRLIRVRHKMMTDGFDKYIIFRGKGFYASYFKRFFIIEAWFEENEFVQDQNRRRSDYMKWKYGKTPRKADGMESVLDVPALGVDGL